MKITVRAIKCTECGDTIFSRAHHDMIWCSCNSIAIDGGINIVGMKNPPSYTRIVGDVWEKTELIFDFPNINEAKIVFYEDWNKKINKYGRSKK